MKKILTVFSAIDIPWHSITFAVKLAKENSGVIHAIFLNSDKEKSDSQYSFPNDLSTIEGKYNPESISDSNKILIDNNIKRIKEQCEASGVSFSSEKNISILQLIDKTSGTDLLIADSQSDFLENVLPHINCPAFMACENEMPQKIVLMYNNSTSSKFAIEKYSSLFSAFKNLPTYVLSINPEKENEPENERYFKEKLEPYFNNIILKSLHGNTENEMKNFIEELPGHVIIVMGAFGRSAVSMFFHQSLASNFLHKNRVSLFIAHK